MKLTRMVERLGALCLWRLALSLPLAPGCQGFIDMVVGGVVAPYFMYHLAGESKNHGIFQLEK